MTRDEDDTEKAKARVIAACLPRTGEGFERTEGKGSSDAPLRTDRCPACERPGGVRYRGSDVLEGDLAMNHLVHTEVADWFACMDCAAEWSELRFV